MQVLGEAFDRGGDVLRADLELMREVGWEAAAGTSGLWTVVSPGFRGVGLLDRHPAIPAGGRHGQTGLSGGVSAVSP